MAGRPKKFLPKLSEQDKEALEKISRSQKAEKRKVLRANILLLSDEGYNNTQIAEKLGISRPVVNKITKRFAAAGIGAALEDAARTGRPQEFGIEERTWVQAMACKSPKELDDGPAQQLWSLSSLTKYVREHCLNYPELQNLKDVGETTVWRILQSGDLHPHKIKYYLERVDENFDEKAKEVLMLYKRIEWITQAGKKYGADIEELSLLSNEVFVSYDEKPGIQAIEHKYNDRQPNKLHGFVRRDYEDVRHGTVSLLAGIDLLTGKVYGLVRDSHTSKDFVDFLKTIDNVYPKNILINVILDNHSAHRSKETLTYLESCPNRFKFTFTPKHGSWLNLVEAFFGKMARTCLKGLRVKSKEELIKHIDRWINQINEDPMVYRWKWNLEDIESAFT